MSLFEIRKIVTITEEIHHDFGPQPEQPARKGAPELPAPLRENEASVARHFAVNEFAVVLGPIAPPDARQIVFSSTNYLCLVQLSTTNIAPPDARQTVRKPVGKPARKEHVVA